MSTILVTAAVAFIMVSIALALLGFSLLVKGKSTIKPGACGRDPTKLKEDCNDNFSCTLCKHDEKQCK
ncbi:hypothetical protein BN1013_02264 [Candidatus Rubidus massiliensis]|nr:MAG: hypothetical protein BGO10_06115 [Chlamydia sp. 32-24]CDZ81728.1 hypothetical protein BN1013_02264 [Candidatus Rubidus massiliensis]